LSNCPNTHLLLEKCPKMGYVISEKGVATCPDKVKVLVEWPSPKNIKELRSFLGLAGYYRKFVHHFGIISRPLTDMLKNNAVFIWTDEQEIAF
jgi:hypothetical protein